MRSVTRNDLPGSPLPPEGSPRLGQDRWIAGLTLAVSVIGAVACVACAVAEVISLLMSLGYRL
jgi:hypothetical protein